MRLGAFLSFIFNALSVVSTKKSTCAKLAELEAVCEGTSYRFGPGQSELRNLKHDPQTGMETSKRTIRERDFHALILKLHRPQIEFSSNSVLCALDRVI
jgi:hypothetical protein